MRRGFTWDQVTFAFFPVFNVKRLRHFRGGIVLNRQRHDVGFFAEVAYADFREFLSDAFIDVPVAFGFPGRVNGGRQRVNKRMHIRGIHIVFFVPGCGRQYDVGVQTGARQTEVERDDQIQFAVKTVIPPLDFFRLHAALLAKVLALNTVLGTQQVLEHIFMAFTGGAQQVGTPDKQVTRMVFTVLRLLGRKANRPLFQRFHGVIDRRHAGFLRFVSNTQRVHAQLRRRRQPAHTLSAHVEVDQMSAIAGFIRHRRQQFLRGDGFIAPLAGVVIEVRCTVHVACRTLPVKAERQRLPAGLRTQFFLTNVVRPTAAALANAAAEDQHVDQTAVVHVQMEPVVQARTDDNHRAAMGLIGVIGKFARGTDDVRAGYAGDFFCPGWSVRLDVIVAGRAVFIVQTAFQAVVRHGQVVNGSHQRGGTIGHLQAFYRQFVQQNVFEVDFVEMLGTFAAKVWETDVGDIIMAAKQAKAQLNFFAGFTIALFEVPLAFVAPAETQRTVRYGHFALLVKGDGFPFRILLLAQGINQVGSAQHTASGIVAVALFEHDQHRHVGVATYVIGEVLARFIEMELTQHDVAHRQRHRGIGTLLRRQPQIAELGDFGIVRSNRHGFGPFVANFGKEMRVRGTGLRDVGAPGDDVAGVIPVGRFRHIGLFAPGHRRGWRQVAVPVVEAQTGTANQRQVTGAGRIGNHRHRRDRREACHAVWTVSFDGIDV